MNIIKRIAIGKENVKEMKKYLMISITIINIIFLLLDIKTVLPVVVLCIFIGFIKGINSKKVSDIYNLHKFVIRVESIENVFELMNSILISVVAILASTDQIEIADCLYIIVCAIILYRFLFYDFCKSIGEKESCS